MSLSMRNLLDGYKQKFLQFLGDTDFRDQLLRVLVSYQDFVLTAAQMDTLNATPVTVLAAPGAGMVNIVDGIVVKVVGGATAFELGSGVLSFQLTDGSGVKVTGDVTNATVEVAAGTTAYESVLQAAGVQLANAVVVAKTSADVTAGDGNVYGRIYYRTIKASELV